MQQQCNNLIESIPRRSRLKWRLTDGLQEAMTRGGFKTNEVPGWKVPIVP